MKKILVVDDEPGFVKIAGLRLKYSGYEVVTAVDGEEALDRARDSSPDLILLDIKLPKRNGFEVCRILKADPVLSKIPVVFCSADATTAIAQEAPRFGAAGYLIKPFEHEEMLEIFKNIFG